jgi:hypothetical protein
MNELMVWLKHLHCQTEDNMNFLVGMAKNLSLAVMPGFWRGNGWFGVNFLTPTSTKILLESSFQRLFIGVINTWWFQCEI